ncbi:MAG: DUF5110 domain-containing protein [Spirochaetales bacterium]|nr:DUF5110 domain-containing protein [Spirochaetales bacterium]
MGLIPDKLTRKLMVYYVLSQFRKKKKMPSTWLELGHCKKYSLEKKNLILDLECENGKVAIEALRPDIFKVSAFQTKAFPYETYSIIEQGRIKLKTKEINGMLYIETSSKEKSLIASVDLEKSTLSFMYNDTLLHSEARAAAQSEGWVSCAKKTHIPEYYVGFGQKTGTFFKNNSEMIMYNTDDPNYGPTSDPLYQSCPVQIALREDGTAHGLFYDNPGYSFFKTGSRNPQAKSHYYAENAPLVYYVLAGPSLKDVLRQIADLTGHYELPPLWVLGHHHSRWEENDSEERMQDLAATFRKKNIPCDVLHIDIGHMEGYRCFTWNQKTYKRPDDLIRIFHNNGFRAVIIADPGLKKDDDWDIYKQGLDKKYFVVDQDGKPVIAPVWPGDAAFVDFTNPEACAWWGSLYRDYVKKGLDGFWNDMNEPSQFTKHRTMPDDAVHKGGDGHPSSRHARIHNLYGFLMARATYEGLKKLMPKKRFFLFSRSSYTGIQRYASTWTGDNRSIFAHLKLSIPMVLNMGLSGQIMTGPDIGGFWGHTNRELLVRWMEIGAFYPFSRNHTARDTRAQEVWKFDFKTENACRKYIALRYMLLPYLYTSLEEGTREGIPMMRPLCIEFPYDRQCLQKRFAETEFLCGADLLVAPIMKTKSYMRQVYFPEGPDWHDFWTGRLYEGGSTRIVDAPIDVIPVFVRRGAVIPMIQTIQSTRDYPLQKIILNVYPALRISGSLYIDDGITYDFTKNKYSLLSIEGSLRDNKLLLTVTRQKGKLSPALHKHSGITYKILKQEQPVTDIRINGRSLMNKKEAWEITESWLTIKQVPSSLPQKIEIMYKPKKGVI